VKHIRITLTAVFLLAACTIPPAAPIQTPAIPFAARTTATAAPIKSTTGNTAEETRVRDLVESFGKKLQVVSLLAPDAAQEIQQQYSGFVTPALLEIWMKNVSKAPGRMTSSPWPDRIEIIALTNEGSDKFEINGFVVEITSLEVVNGGAAARIPVHIVAVKDQGHWLITEYAEGQ